jgi:hypothetical protein
VPPVKKTRPLLNVLRGTHARTNATASNGRNVGARVGDAVKEAGEHVRGAVEGTADRLSNARRTWSKQ